MRAVTSGHSLPFSGLQFPRVWNRGVKVWALTLPCLHEWELVEDTSLPGQNQGWFIAHGNSSKQSVSIFLSWFSEPHFAQDDVKRARQYLLTQWVVLQKTNPKIRESETFIVPAFWSGGEHCLYLLSLLVMQNPWKCNPEQKQSGPVLIRHTETWASHGKLYSSRGIVF